MTDIITSAKDLQSAFDDLELVGRRILSFDVVGRLAFLDHQFMIDIYNNYIAPEGGPYRKPDSAIFEDELPLDLVLTRMLSTDGPCAMGLDDGRVFTIQIPGYSQARIAASANTELAVNGDVDAGKIRLC